MGLGVFLCITSVCSPIIGDMLNLRDWVKVSPMFIMIAAAVAIFIFSNTSMSKWYFLNQQPCQIDMLTANYLHEEKIKYSSTHALRLSIGIILCILCWLPTMMFDNLYAYEDIGSVFLFILVGIGVFMIIITSIKRNSYDTLLTLNDINTISGNYVEDQKPVYINSTVQFIMDIYWPTVTCIYLIWSFITFAWWRTWFIWPIAGIIHSVLKKNLSKE